MYRRIRATFEFAQVYDKLDANTWVSTAPRWKIFQRFMRNGNEFCSCLAFIGVDSSKLSLMVLGAITFWVARKLSGNPLFYYLCGVVLGITTSIVILVYVISKLLPKVCRLFSFPSSSSPSFSFFLPLLSVSYYANTFTYVSLRTFPRIVVCGVNRYMWYYYAFKGQNDVRDGCHWLDYELVLNSGVMG